MTRMRSLLFVPGDSERKLQKSSGVAADVLVLDLEDSVVPANKAAARGLVREYLSGRESGSGTEVWVRINAVASAEAGTDLAVVMPARPDGIMLPKSRSPEDVELLGRRLGTDHVETHPTHVGLVRDIGRQ